MHPRKNEIVWQNLYQAIQKNSGVKANFRAALQIFKLSLPDKSKKLKEYVDEFMKIYREEETPIPNETPFILDMAEVKTGDTLLIAAVRQQQPETIRLLLDEGCASVHIKNKYNETALDIAIKMNTIVSSQLLLANDAEINIKVIFEHLPNAGDKTEDFLKLLIQKKISLNEIDSSGHTAMDYVYSRPELAELFASYGAIWNPQKIALTLPQINMERARDWINLLIKHHINLNDVLPAVINHHPTLIQLLIDNKAEPSRIDNDNMLCIVQRAVGSRQIKQLELLISNGAKIPDAAVSCVIGEIYNDSNYEKWVDLLITSKCNLNVGTYKHNNSPLIFVAYKNNDHLVERLIAAGADVNFTNTDREDALDYAVKYYNWHMIMSLVAAGANISAYTTLCSAVETYAQWGADKSVLNSVLLRINELCVSKQDPKLVSLLEKYAPRLETELHKITDSFIIPDLVDIMNQYTLFKTSPKKIMKLNEIKESDFLNKTPSF